MGDSCRLSTLSFSVPSCPTLGPESVRLRTFASMFCERLSDTAFCASAPRYTCRFCPTAWRYSLLTLLAGAYEYETTGLTMWRNRRNGPKPGNSPKIVGAADTPYVRRFDWCTNFPPLR